MNIHSNFELSQSLPSQTAATRAGGPSSNSGTSAAAPASFTDGDQTHLSQAALDASASLHGSDVRAQKVAAVQQALASGTYSVSPSDLAGKLIDHLLQR